MKEYNNDMSKVDQTALMKAIALAMNTEFKRQGLSLRPGTAQLRVSRTTVSALIYVKKDKRKSLKFYNSL